MSWRSSPPEDAAGRLADLRVSYDAATLEASDLRGSPLAQFQAWFDDARAIGLPEPNAMILATASVDGRPSARTVLLKGVDGQGFAFFTNLESRKGAELAANPAVSLVFPWFAMHRQVVVEGAAELVDRAEVDAYFASRPRGSRLGAWASRQSTVLDDRATLEERYARLEEQYPEGADIPAPPFWGGWLVRARGVEFWQGRESRLHDRLRFRAVGAGADLGRPADWSVERLSP